MCGLGADLAACAYASELRTAELGAAPDHASRLPGPC